MLRYASVRLLQALVALFVVVSAVFALGRLSGDPAELLAPPEASTEQVDAIRAGLGLDRPVIVQFGDYLWGILHGDLGDSISFAAPVAELIGKALPNTLILALSAFAFAILVGIPLGMLSGMRAGGKVDAIVRVLSLTGQSVPSFWLGILLIFGFAVVIPVFPASGAASLSSVIMPAFALGAFSLASITRLTRSAVIDILRQDQSMFLRTKGVSAVVFSKHVLRNASLPVVTLAGIQLGTLISGTIVIETLFAWPGIGQMAIQAINNRDYALIQGIVIVNTMVFVALLFLVDLSYGYLDPRVRRTHGSPIAG